MYKKKEEKKYTQIIKMRTRSYARFYFNELAHFRCLPTASFPAVCQHDSIETHRCFSS